MITNENRRQRITEISDETFAVYTSTEITQAIKQSLLTYNINNKDAFVECVGDTVIGLIPRAEFEKRLISDVGVAPEHTLKIARDLKVLFDKAEGSTRPEANLETKERLDLRPRTPVSAPGLNQAGTPPKPLTREELMNALGGKRTMAQDIETLRMKQGEKKDGA